MTRVEIWEEVKKRLVKVDANFVVSFSLSQAYICHTLTSMTRESDLTPHYGPPCISPKEYQRERNTLERHKPSPNLTCALGWFEDLPRPMRLSARLALCDRIIEEIKAEEERAYRVVQSPFSTLAQAQQQAEELAKQHPANIYQVVRIIPIREVTATTITRDLTKESHS